MDNDDLKKINEHLKKYSEDDLKLGNELYDIYKKPMIEISLLLIKNKSVGIKLLSCIVSTCLNSSSDSIDKSLYLNNLLHKEVRNNLSKLDLILNK